MIVLINGKEFEYQSDYPEGWKFSAGDPFKFPVQIGDQLCFVKRFEQKNPKNISGWELLLKLTGKTEQNLSKIYDIKKVEEKNKSVFYIFYEYLDGNTLDKRVRNGEINLSILNSSLFNGIRSLQKYDFWFADFCEKNIFCRKDGTFVLVDIDSTQKTVDMPDNEMYGSKDYWILVFKFYKEILNKTDIKLSDINGISFNFLQIVFLIFRLKLFYQGKNKDYNSTGLYNLLHLRLNDTVPEIREIFLKALQYGLQPLTEDQVTKLEKLVEEKIIKVEQLKEAPAEVVNLPVIKQFTSSKTEIERGEEFILSWQVENANKLELHKNGAMYRSIESSKTSINLVGFADGTQQQSSYQIVAYKDLTMAKSEPLTISLKSSKPVVIDPGKDKRKKLIVRLAVAVGVLVLLAVIIILIRNRNKSPFLKVQYIREKVDTTITIYGSGFVTQDLISVRLNDTVAGILNVSKDSILVKLPSKKYTPSNSDTVFVFLQMKNQTQNVGSFAILPAPTIRQREVFEDSTVTIRGKKLNTPAIKVFLGGKELSVTSETDDSIMAKIPQLTDTVKGQAVNLSVKENSKVIYSKNWIVAYDNIDLDRIASQAIWIGGVLSDDGNSMGYSAGLSFPGNQNNTNGFALNLHSFMEDDLAYQVLETHPAWYSRGTIKGFFPWQKLNGKKVFTSRVGFIKNGQSTDGVTFQVWVHYKVGNTERWELIKALKKQYTGSLEMIRTELPKHVPNNFYIELRVDAGNMSNIDWAAWVEPAVVSRKLRTRTHRDRLINHHLPLEIIVNQ